MSEKTMLVLSENENLTVLVGAVLLVYVPASVVGAVVALGTWLS